MSGWYHTKSIHIQMAINGSYHTHIVSIMNIKKWGHSTQNTQCPQPQNALQPQPQPQNTQCPQPQNNQHSQSFDIPDRYAEQIRLRREWEEELNA